MKKKNKKNQIRMRFPTIVLCILAILLCAAPRGWAVIYDDGGEHDVTEDVVGSLEIGTDTTVNLYASVSQYVYAGPGSVLNIYSGDVGLYVVLSIDEPYAVVTVYGTDFGGDGDFSVPGQVSYSGGTLTGYYADGSVIDLWFFSQLPILLGTTGAPEVKIIDIKPGSDLNSINLKSKGVVPVAVLTTWDFDASTIDPDTVKFAGVSPVRWTLDDVDNDGDVDSLFHFKTQELNLDKSSIDATLTGQTQDGIGIAGTDTVRIVQTKK